MSKALYLVNVIPQEPRRDDQLGPSHQAGFVEEIRASNRREAMILVRRKYPGYVVLDNVVKAI
jgi:hypothetical protein